VRIAARGIFRLLRKGLGIDIYHRRAHLFGDLDEGVGRNRGIYYFERCGI
jgi:hypothetical protein